MAYWMGRSEFGTGPFARIDLNAMAASVTAHAIVAALLVFTWGETVLVEGAPVPASSASICPCARADPARRCSRWPRHNSLGNAR
ncbi:hypothetical protein ACFSLT_27465 [Novosphingobium resinovorum]